MVPPPSINRATGGSARVSSKAYFEAEAATQQRPKILFIGDSISNHANFKVLANAKEAEIVTAKAYSSIYNDVSK